MRLRPTVLQLAFVGVAALWSCPVGAQVQPTIPDQFAELADRLYWEDNLRIEDAIAVPGPQGGYLAIVGKVNGADGGPAEYRLLILKAGSPGSIVYRDTSVLMRLDHAHTGSDLNADGLPEVTAMTDPGGSAPDSHSYTILTVGRDAVKEIYRGPLHSLVDLDGDGILDVVEIHETFAEDGRSVTFLALRWNGQAYVQSPLLETQESFKRLVADQATFRPNAEEQSLGTRKATVRQQARRAKADKDRDVRLGLKPGCDLGNVTFLVMALRMGTIAEKEARNCRVPIGMLKVLNSNREGWTFVFNFGDEPFPPAAAIRSLYPAGALLHEGDLKFLGLRPFHTDRGVVLILPTFAPLGR